MPTITATGPTYCSMGDETAFFTWLGSIGCVDKVGGVGRDLVIQLKRHPGNKDLRERIGIFCRYKMNMKSLAVFVMPKNATWFADPQMYWHRRVFK